MKITQEVREFAAAGLEAKGEEFRKSGGELYVALPETKE